ncbi:hypothetical protein [Adhaeribacter pallidiroseus]|uniref:Uncharacterized protein n=1 Tax=Adhaeribacter pallidiroseus TaxID=2072847 RepID=A0A369QRW7_9BACT|nr:hypothetical protein [Adhaeribacter pallidiroseus]RDC66405.1 hypothetical protein AHMF7616_05036 [Adhaeribacter pallidiroseus]
MKAVDLDTKLVNSYLEILKKLSPANKLDLIAKLTQSVKSDLRVKDDAFEQTFGTWENSESTKELASPFDFSWEGELEELNTKFDSVQLQHHINNIRE